ncbi:MAG: hypothetical protein ACOC33_03595 [bacterium]
MKIGLDIDEVICDWVSSWMKKYGFKERPTTWYFDDKIMERFETMRKNQGKSKWFSELDEFYLNLKPLFFSNELPFEPHCYITARPVNTEITNMWLKAYDFPDKLVYTVPSRTSKVNAAKKAAIDIFIDDSYENFIDLNDNGIRTYLFTREHNKQYDVGEMRIDSFSDLLVLK